MPVSQPKQKWINISGVTSTHLNSLQQLTKKRHTCRKHPQRSTTCWKSPQRPFQEKLLSYINITGSTSTSKSLNFLHINKNININREHIFTVITGSAYFFLQWAYHRESTNCYAESCGCIASACAYFSANRYQLFSRLLWTHPGYGHFLVQCRH